MGFIGQRSTNIRDFRLLAFPALQGRVDTSGSRGDGSGKKSFVKSDGRPRSERSSPSCPRCDAIRGNARVYGIGTRDTGGETGCLRRSDQVIHPRWVSRGRSWAILNHTLFLQDSWKSSMRFCSCSEKQHRWARLSPLA